MSEFHKEMEIISGLSCKIHIDIGPGKLCFRSRPTASENFALLSGPVEIIICHM